MEILRHFGFSDLQAGEAIVLQVVDGPRGKMAGAVHSWDNIAWKITVFRSRLEHEISSIADDSRGVAQPGSATVLGTVGREFESRRPDHLKWWEQLETWL